MHAQCLCMTSWLYIVFLEFLLCNCICTSAVIVITETSRKVQKKTLAIVHCLPPQGMDRVIQGSVV